MLEASIARVLLCLRHQKVLKDVMTREGYAFGTVRRLFAALPSLPEHRAARRTAGARDANASRVGGV